MRLVWVDANTGAYNPLQRRGYTPELTWEGYPVWTLEEVDRLIRICDQNPSSSGKCSSHNREVLNPFSVFLLRDEKSGNGSRNDPQEVQNFVQTFNSESGGYSEQPSSRETEPDGWNIKDSVDKFPVIYGTDNKANAPGDTYSSLAELPQAPQISEGEEETVQDRATSDAVRQQITHYLAAQTTPFLRSPKTSLTLKSIPQQEKLFQYFLSHVAILMVPVDTNDGGNPWRTAYPGISNRDVSSSRSLYYSILSQSAYHLSMVKGQRGNREETMAVRYFGAALRELQQSLKEHTQDYSSVMGAMLNIMMAEHVFRGNNHGWRSHLEAGMRLVVQNLAQRPWLFSQEAWVITQNFSLMYVIAHTVKPLPATPRTSNENFEDVFDVLCDVMARPSFGYTMGTTARHIKAIYHAQLIEAQTKEEEFASGGTCSTTERLREKVGWIVKYLHTPESNGFATYLDNVGTPLMSVSRAKVLIDLHLHLFNAGVTVYVLSTILLHPPAVVAAHVWSVLSDAWAFVGISPNSEKCCSLTIWPVFVASADAYTPEAQAVATQIWELLSQTYGVGNRRNLKRLLYQIWAERERLAEERHCELGSVRVDWREVMREMGIEILLL
jgi:Fungal specific transcription factor domain